MNPLKITRVWFDAALATAEGKDATLGVDFDNGHCVVLTLDPIMNEPLFADIVRGRWNTGPETDGECVFWANGASLTLDDVIKMLLTGKKAGAAV